MISKRHDKIDELCIHLRRWENLYKNKVKFNSLNSLEKKLLGYNAAFKDKYKNQRCFILGNGPSVNNIDFKQLENELVITVNNMYFHKNYWDLKSNFHFLVDPTFFNLNKHSEKDLPYIKRIDVLLENGTTLFTSIHALNGVKRNGWHKKDVHYLNNGLYFYEGYREEIDFTRYIPAFQGVILYCIAFAIYMGCKEVYLLGCDMTDIVPTFQAFMNQQYDLLYAFEVPNESKVFLKEMGKKQGLEYMLYGYHKIVWGFSELYQYCKRNDVKMYNCSQESILDSIPKCKFEDIL